MQRDDREMTSAEAAAARNASGPLLAATGRLCELAAMYDLLLFCGAVVVALYLYYWYRSDLLQALEARQRVCERRQREERRRAERIHQLAGSCGGAVRPEFFTIQDSFKTHGELLRAIHRSGVRTIRPIIGLDFSASNEWQGNRSFNHQSLHKISSSKSPNPYQRALRCVGRTLEPFMDGDQVHAYGFGDAACRDRTVFTLRADGKPCEGFPCVQRCYKSAARQRTLGGPSGFGALVRQAVLVASRGQRPGELHLLVIVTDGQLLEPAESAAAIVESSSRPLSIALVGVGDGPWDTMQAFDDFLPSRRFDNVQFVQLDEVCAEHGSGPTLELAFTLHLLMEVPEHFQLMCELGYTRRRRTVEPEGTLPAPSSDLSPTATAGCWPRTVKVESCPTRIIAGDPTPRLRRKLLSYKK